MKQQHLFTFAPHGADLRKLLGVTLGLLPRGLDSVGARPGPPIAAVTVCRYGIVVSN